MKVHAVKSTRGPPATTVHVEIDPTKLREEIGEFGAVERVVAEIPEQSDWRAEHMHKEAVVPRASGEPLEKYSVTHYGPSDSGERGVGVTLDTEAGPVAAQGSREAHSVCEEGKPDDSHTIPSRTRE